MPNYALSPDSESIEVLRVVVHETQKTDSAALLFTEIMSITEELESKNSHASALTHFDQKEKAQVIGNRVPKQEGSVASVLWQASAATSQIWCPGYGLQ